MLRLGWMFVISTLLMSFEVRAQTEASISFQGDTVHLELSGRENWVYEIKRVKRSGQTWLDLLVEPLSKSAIQNLTRFKSDYVKSVAVDTKGVDGRHIIQMHLVDPLVEHFDYLTDKPSRLIVDLYITPENLKKIQARKEKETEKTQVISSEKSVLQETVRSTESSYQNATGGKPQRKVATDSLVVRDNGFSLDEVSKGKNLLAGIFDGADPYFERFIMKDFEIREEAILRAKENFYIPFPSLNLPNRMWEKILAAQPTYSIEKSATDEDKQAKLLEGLFRKKRFNVFLQTHKWFSEKYPKSSYHEIFDFMVADIYDQMYRSRGEVEIFDIAIMKYRDALRKHPNSPVAERTKIFIPWALYERGDVLSALSEFQQILKDDQIDDDSYTHQLALLGEAMSLQKLFRYEDAMRAFDQLEKNTKFEDIRMEAAFRKGDVYQLEAASIPIPEGDLAKLKEEKLSFLERKKKAYVAAIEEYQRALKAYPKGADLFPNAFYNQGEAYFQLGKYRQSLDAYRSFVTRFPKDGEAPFAMTRIGELLEILGADQSRVMGVYLETSFRFGENPKAIVARLRLLSQRMKNLSSKEVDGAVKQIMDLAKRVDLPNIVEFSTVMVADGYSRRGEYQKATDLLISFFQQNPRTIYGSAIQKRIESNIIDKIRTLVTKGDFIEALKTHMKYADNRLRFSNRMDTPYYIGRAYELAGAYRDAKEQYLEVINRVSAVKGSEKEKELLILDHLPPLESLNLRAAAVEYKLNNWQAAYDYIRAIRNPEKMSEEEQIERITLAVDLLDRREDLDSAIRFLTELLRKWSGQPAKVAGPWLQLAKIEIKQGKREEALRSLERVDLLMSDTSNVKEELHAEALEIQGNILFELGRIDEAIEVYKKLIDRYESRMSIAPIRYKLGKIYFDRGERQKAADIWSDFRGNKADFWASLAKEQLDNAKWAEEYKRYLRRIPASAGGF
ncbi:MAG: tetratricopeptide repeat protein [Bdellovibrionaceae bacterium]|nr:tetratricopeptide repeat protein [Pseudobdellovibrionaceae bacterium]